MPQENEYHRIMVAVDGSEQSKRALNKAIRYAKDNDKQLLIVQIVPDFDNYYAKSYNSANFSYFLVQEKQRLQPILQGYADAAEKQGVRVVKTIVEIGSPKKLLSEDIPKKEKIDAIFMGATGLSGLQKVFIGSIARFVVLHATCDVIIVK